MRTPTVPGQVGWLWPWPTSFGYLITGESRFASFSRNGTLGHLLGSRRILQIPIWEVCAVERWVPLVRLPHRSIWQVRASRVSAWLDELAVIVASKNVHLLVTKLKEIVPEYTPSPEILSLAEVDRHDRFGTYQSARTGLTNESQ